MATPLVRNPLGSTLPNNSVGSHFVILGPFSGQPENASQRSADISMDFARPSAFTMPQAQRKRFVSQPMLTNPPHMSSIINAFANSGAMHHSQGQSLMFAPNQSPGLASPRAFPSMNSSFPTASELLARVQSAQSAPNVSQPMLPTPQMFQQGTVALPGYAHSHTNSQDAAQSHSGEDEAGVVINGMRFTKEQIKEIYSLRSAATAGEESLHKKAAGRSVIVAQLYDLPAKTIRDIWARDICAEWTAEQWTRHEQVLYECAELIKTGDIPPRTERSRPLSLLEGSDNPVTDATRRGRTKRRASDADGGDESVRKAGKKAPLSGGSVKSPTSSAAQSVLPLSQLINEGR